MSGKTPRTKGAGGELEVLRLIQARWPATRGFASGGQGGGDIAGGPQGVCWEIKRTERLRLRQAWRQLEQAAGPNLPVLATRWNGSRYEPAQWLAILPLDELLALLQLKEQ